MLELPQLMSLLAKRRPLFHSEADFQHALAWHIKEEIDTEVRLEVPYGTGGDRRYLDIWLPQKGVAIELKYFTRKPDPRKRAVYLNDESYVFRDQGAQDIRRYDFLNDIKRLEMACEEWEDCKTGLAILLTNDHLYWRDTGRRDTVDAALRFHEGRTLAGNLAWAAKASAGTTKGRQSDIELQGRYQIRWQDYRNLVTSKYGEFRYLTIRVAPEEKHL